MPTGIGGEVVWVCPSLDDSRVDTSIVSDFSPNGWNGTISGATWQADTSNGGKRALSFDGIDDFIALSNTGVNLNFETTISLWIKPIYRFQLFQSVLELNIYPDDSIFTDSTGGAASQLLRWRLSGRPDIVLPNPAGNWTFAAYKWEGLKSYIWNGTDWVFYTTKNGSLITKANIRIGDRVAAGRALYGYLDDIRIFNRAVTTEEMLLLQSKRGYEPITDTRRPRIAGPDVVGSLGPVGRPRIVGPDVVGGLG